MRTLRASEIGSYLYCQRSWWYLKNGQPSENNLELAAGSDLHARHGRTVLHLGCARIMAYALLLLALALIAAALTSQFLQFAALR